MATTKITDLTAYTDPVNTDVLPIVDVTSDVTKKVSIANVMKNASLGSAAAPGISFDGDPNTGIYSPGANQVAVSTDGTARLTASTTAITAAIPVDVLLGSASTPSYTFTGDLNTGIYSPGADQVAISTNGTGRLFVDASGNVGVGATATTRLEVARQGAAWTGVAPVSGTALFVHSGSASTTSPARLSILSGNAIDAAIYFGDTDNNSEAIIKLDNTDDSLQFAVNGSERLRITSAGLVGVGTSSPAALLHLSSSANTTLRLTDTAGSYSDIIYNESGSVSQLILDADPTGSSVATGGTSILLKTDGSTAMTIDSSQRVGIGTSSVDSLLHLSKSDATTYNATATDGQVGIGPTIYLENPANLNTAVGGQIVFGMRSTEEQARIGATGGTGMALTFGTNDAERMRITSTGVGIGTTSPQARLHIANETTPGQFGRILFDANVTSGYDTKIEATDVGLEFTAKSTSRGFAFSTGSTPLEKVRIDSSGRVGIGTSSVDSPLHINAASYATASNGTVLLKSTTSASNDGSQITFGTDAGRHAAIAGRTESGTIAGYLQLGTRGSSGDILERVRIDSSGRVGIGTSSFANNVLLSLKSDTGSITCGALFEDTGTSGRKYGIYTGSGYLNLRDFTAGENRLVIDSSGRVGIGTTSPVQKLEVAESDSTTVAIRASNSTGNFSLIRSSSSTNELRANDTAPIIFSHTAGTAERARIDSSGRLLVGTSSSPSAGDGQYSNQVIQGYVGVPTGQGLMSLQRGETAPNITSNETIGVISFNDSAGYVFGQIYCQADANAGASDFPGRLVFSTTADGASSPTERMRIDSSGKVFVGMTTTTGDGVAFEDTSSGGRLYVGRNNADSVAEFQYSGTRVGQITITSSSTSYVTSSDYRLKENVTAVTDGITRLQQLKPSRFNFIADPGKTVDGFIAHEVQAVVPEAITGEKDAVDADGNPKYQGIDQSKLVPLLTAALQEAVAKIESLEARLTAAGI